MSGIVQNCWSIPIVDNIFRFLLYHFCVWQKWIWDPVSSSQRAFSFNYPDGCIRMIWILTKKVSLNESNGSASNGREVTVHRVKPLEQGLDILWKLYKKRSTLSSIGLLWTTTRRRTHYGKLIRKLSYRTQLFAPLWLSTHRITYFLCVWKQLETWHFLYRTSIRESLNEHVLNDTSITRIHYFSSLSAEKFNDPTGSVALATNPCTNLNILICVLNHASINIYHALQLSTTAAKKPFLQWFIQFHAHVFSHYRWTHDGYISYPDLGSHFAAAGLGAISFPNLYFPSLTRLASDATLKLHCPYL